MSDNLMDKVNALGERLKITGAEVSKKMSAGMTSMSFKMKEFFQGHNPAEKIVEEATSENLEGPDWGTNLEICDLINTEKVNSVELIRAIKKRLTVRDPRVQFMVLFLLETIVKNCEKAFSEVAAERVLDEMVKLVDDPQTVVNIRNKALVLIEAWGESGDELRYLPVYEETYKSLKSRGIRFPGRDDESLAPIFTPPRSVPEAESYAEVPQEAFVGGEFAAHGFTSEQTRESLDVARNSIELLSTVLSSSPTEDALQDDLTSTLVQQCHQSQYTVQRIIETGADEAVLFEALNINDELQKVLTKYEELKKAPVEHAEPRLARIPVAVEPEDSPRVSKEDELIRRPPAARTHTLGPDDDMMDDLDEMIFGKGNGAGTGMSHGKEGDGKRDKDDLISF